MKDVVKNFFYYVKTNEEFRINFRSEINKFAETYTDELHDYLTAIVNEPSIDKINTYYYDAVKKGMLKECPNIACAFALNPNTSSLTINSLCKETTANRDFLAAVCDNHLDKLTLSTIQEIYPDTSTRIMNHFSKFNYSKPNTIADLPLSAHTISAIALAEFFYQQQKIRDLDPSTTYKWNKTNNSIFRFVTDEHTIDIIVDKIKSSPSKKSQILVEILNNYFISDKKKDEIFNLFNDLLLDARYPSQTTENLYPALNNTTPQIVSSLFKENLEFLFEESISDWRFIHQTKHGIENLITGTPQLTEEQECKLMKKILEQKKRSSEYLTGTLVRHTNSPKTLLLALCLKSVLDKDAAIENKHLSTEDIIDVALVSAKKIESELQKDVYPSDKHVTRLGNLALRTTLPDKVYQTIFKSNDHKSLSKVAYSKFTPPDILQKIIDMASDKSSFSYPQIQASIYLFGIKNGLPIEKTQQLMDIVEDVHDSRRYNYELSFDSYNMQHMFTNFFKDNPHITLYKSELDRLTNFVSEYYQKRLTQIIKGIEEFPSYQKKEMEEKTTPTEPVKQKDLTKISDKSLSNKITSFSYYFYSVNRDSLINTEVNLKIEEYATEFMNLINEFNRRKNKENEVPSSDDFDER